MAMTFPSEPSNVEELGGRAWQARLHVRISVLIDGLARVLRPRLCVRKDATLFGKANIVHTR